MKYNIKYWKIFSFFLTDFRVKCMVFHLWHRLMKIPLKYNRLSAQFQQPMIR